MINGFDSLIVTKLDVLDHLAVTIPVCVAYEIDGKRVTEMPARQEQLLRVKPVYEDLPGWQTSTRGVKISLSYRIWPSGTWDSWRSRPASRPAAFRRGRNARRRW